MLYPHNYTCVVDLFIFYPMFYILKSNKLIVMYCYFHIYFCLNVNQDKRPG